MRHLAHCLHAHECNSRLVLKRRQTMWSAASHIGDRMAQSMENHASSGRPGSSGHLPYGTVMLISTSTLPVPALAHRSADPAFVLAAPVHRIWGGALPWRHLVGIPRASRRPTFSGHICVACRSRAPHVCRLGWHGFHRGGAHRWPRCGGCSPWPFSARHFPTLLPRSGAHGANTARAAAARHKGYFNRKRF